MASVPADALDWEGRTVLDRAGEKIGRIEEIFLVEETGEPEWALVKLGRRKGRTTLVPLTKAHPVDKGVAVDVEKDVVSEAPEIEADREPSEQQVNALYRHYRLTNGSSAPAGSPASSPREALITRPAAKPAAAPTAAAAAGLSLATCCAASTSFSPSARSKYSPTPLTFSAACSAILAGPSLPCSRN